MAAVPVDFFSLDPRDRSWKCFYPLPIFEYEELAAVFRQTFLKIAGPQRTLTVRNNVELGDGSLRHGVLTHWQMSIYGCIQCHLHDGASTSFLRRWLEDASVPTFTSCGVFREGDECPATVLNLWTPFKMNLERGLFCYDGEGCRTVLHLLHVLCNGDAAMACVAMDWIRSTVARSRPTKALAIVGHKQCGMSMLLTLLHRMLGDAKMHRTCRLSRDHVVFEKNQLATVHVLHYHIQGAGVKPHDLPHLQSLLTEGRHAGVSFHACLITHTYLPGDLADGALIHPLIVRIRCMHETIDTAYARRYCELLSLPHTMRSVWANVTRTSPWARLRTKLRVRAIVVYWLFLTTPLMRTGGKAAKRDLASFHADVQ